MTEFELIYRYFSQQHSDINTDVVRQAPICRGLGDDAAVIEIQQGAKWVTCVDTLVQGRHFSADWDQVKALAFAIGYKSVVVNVSDIAAMGATPHSILLAIALPERLANEDWLSNFAKGLFHACTQYGLRLIGGDTTRNDNLIVSITANGIMSNNCTPICRNGAKVGDRIYVSGTIGDASYALNHLDSGTGSIIGNTISKQLVDRLHMPTPRVILGQALAKQGRATSMIDISDGLAQDLSHICQQSGVAAKLNIEQLPTSQPLQKVDLAERLHCQLTGGDDYELLFTLPVDVIPPITNTPVTCIGNIIKAADNDAIVATSDPFIIMTYQNDTVTEATPYPFTSLPELTGYQHFKS